jgi:hypothetical protein
LQELSGELGAKYVKGKVAMQGQLHVGEEEEEVRLELSDLPLRLLAAELAGLYRSSGQLAGLPSFQYVPLLKYSCKI